MSKTERAILDSIEPGDPMDLDAPNKRQSRLVGSPSDVRSPVVVPERVKSMGVCLVSGCGNDIREYRNNDGEFPTVCGSCHAYAMKKIATERGAGHVGVIYRRDIHKALGINIVERVAPTTGRTAAYARGHASTVGRPERRDG